MVARSKNKEWASMTQTAFVQLKNRIAELESMAGEIEALALRLTTGNDVQPELSNKGQQWYRGCREVMVQQGYSGKDEFDQYYDRHRADLKNYFLSESRNGISMGHTWYEDFTSSFMAARALVSAVHSEVRSRELPVKTALSYVVSASEFDTAERMLDEGKGEEVFIRASGMIAGVALERHLFTVAEERSIPVVASKQRATAK
jgi:hypothetical protein